MESMDKNLKESNTEAFRALFPGAQVDVQGIIVTVRPLGVALLRQFSDKIAEAVPKVLRALTDVEATDEKYTEKLVAVLAPIVLSDFLDLLEQCVDVELQAVPHHVLPPIVDAWLEESFGSGKLAAWKQFAEGLQKKPLLREVLGQSSEPASTSS